MDEYELELLEAVENTSEFQRIENFEEEILEAKMAANNTLITHTSVCNKKSHTLVLKRHITIFK